MSTSQVLQHLYSLGTSSPDFLRCLYCLIRKDEEEQYLSNLQGSQLTQLVDFLDEVRPSPLAFVQLTKRTVQILDVGPIADDVLRRCLHKLRTICSRRAILPSSYTISGDLARVGDHPVAFGGFSDVWKGTHNDTNVCIKHLRVSEQIRETLEKVSIRNRLIFFLPTGRYPLSQVFYNEAIMWKRLRHPNIVAFIGVTQSPLQFVSEWMPNGILTEYVNKNPDVNRVGLVSLSSAISARPTTRFQAIGCGRGSQISSCEPDNTWRLERGRFPLYVASSCINNPRLAQHPR